MLVILQHPISPPLTITQARRQMLGAARIVGKPYVARTRPALGTVCSTGE